MEEAEAIVREVWRRWNSGDRELDELLFDPGFEVRSALAQGLYRGPDEVRQWMGEIDEQFEDWQLSIDGIRPLDGDRMLVWGAIRGRGRQSGIDLDDAAAWIIGFRGGRLLSVNNFIGRDARERAEAEAQ
jgi:ketosteroid isomerase-like protein